MRIKRALIAGTLLSAWIGVTPANVQAGAPPESPTVVATYSSSVTVTWGLSDPTSGYIVQASTYSNFSFGIIYSSSTNSLVLSTLTVSGLTPATVYFLRVGAVSGSSVPYTVTAPTSVVTNAPTIPTGLDVSMVGVSSITWYWNPVVGATPYKLYVTSSSAIPITAATATVTEKGLPPNTAISRAVTAVVSGVESGLSNATTVYTQAAVPGTPVFDFVGLSSVTISWNANANPFGTQYQVDQSTSPGFSFFTTPIPFTSTFTLTTTSFYSLSSGVTYYYRVKARNDMWVPTSYSAANSAQLLGAPSGLTGTTLGVSSIAWTWSAVSSATSYTLYMATSPTTAVASGIPSTYYFEANLSTNTAYGRVLSALVAGVESGLSSAATAYTLAATPGGPTFGSVGNSSATLSWSARGNPSSTVYELIQSITPGFSSGNTTPILYSSNFTGTTTTFISLTPGTTYYYKVQAKNIAGVVTAYSPVTSLTTLGASSASGSGQGTASVAPPSISEGGVITSTVTFAVPSSGMTAGGKLQIDLPSGWGPFPQVGNVSQSGYVSVSPGGFTVVASTQGVVLTLTSGFLSSGNTIQVFFQNFYANCPSAAAPVAQWKVKSAMSSSDALTDLAAGVSPQSYTTGAFQSVNFVPWSVVTTAINQATPLLLQASDGCGQPVTLASPLTINLTGLQSDQINTDSTAQFSTTSSFGATTGSVTISASTSAAVVYYRTTAVGNNRWVRGSYVHPVYSGNYQVWRQINVLSQAFAFNGASVDNGTPVTGQVAMNLSPDGDGTNDNVYIRFVPSDLNPVWHVAISSDGFQYNVFERWGTGNPLSSLMWDGRDNRNNGVAPNGTYAVKLEDVNGMTVNTALSITLNTAQISGQVRLGGVAIAGAMVNANGTTGGYASARTDSAGNYTIYGVKAGSVYSLYVSFVSTTTNAQISGQLQSITAPASGRNFNLSSPGILRIIAVTPTPAPATVFGSANLYSSTSNGWGNLRLLAGTTTTDNGDSFNPSTWTILGLAPGAYTLHLNIQGYGAADQGVTVVANATQDLVVNLTARASVFGRITLPAPAPVATWVPVQGSLQGSNFPTVYGGANFNAGQSNAIYSLYAVTPGSYTFKAQPPGFIPLQQSQVVSTVDVGNSSTGGLDFSGFTVGGNISGTLTINGDTTGESSPMALWVNAFSSQLGQNAFVQVPMATHLTQTSASYTIGGLANGTYQVNPPYLSGFSASPPGPQTVVVSGGVGSLNIVMNQNTGQINGAITLPGSSSDYTNVHLSLQGPISVEKDLTSGPSYILNHLDTGYYRLIASYLTTGAQVTLNIAVTNGLAQTVPIDLSIPTYSVSGTVSVQSGFTMTGSSGAVTTINTVSDLLAAATKQTLILGGQQTYTGSGNACTGGVSTVVTTARVEAFPKNFNSYNESNRDGFTNCFGANQYKYGVLDSSGGYSISGLTPGIWEIDVYPYFDSGKNPNVAVSKQVVSILGGNVTGTNFTLAGGNSVAGTISLPTGVTDVRTFTVQVQSDRGDIVQSTPLDVGTVGSPAASADYAFSHLANGNYSLVVFDFGTYDSTLNRNTVRYVAKPVQFQITGGDLTGVNVTASNASRIVGKLAIQGANSDGTSALTLITPNNANLLSSNFNIQAQANPWVPSGYAQASRGNSGGVAIDDNNQFSIDGLIAGTYDVSFRQYSFGASVQGSLNLADYTQGAVAVPQGQTLDLGTITLQPGLPLSGLVTNATGTPLPNIRVRASPSNSQHGNEGQEVFTNSDGKFTFTGLSPKVKVYDFIVAPRPSPNESVQPVPYGQIKKRAVDVTQMPAPNLTFALPSATAGLSGTVSTVDSGALSFPSGDQNGWPAAAVYVDLQGDNAADNPLGDENATALDGSFNITNLPAGVYDITIESLGYRPIKLTGVTLTSVTKSLGAIVLQKGPALIATLTKPDGSAVNTTDVRQAVAASADLSSIIFGQINSDAQTNNIVSIKFGGFELSPKSYSVLLFDEHDNIIVPADGKGLVFTSNTDSVAKALTFQPTAPVALVNVRKSGSDVLVTYYLSRPLRNGVNDQDPTAWLSVTNGLGSLSSIVLSGDRRQLGVTYTPALGEQNASLLFSAHTVDLDAATGVEYVISKSVTLLLGQKATAEQSINAAIGGTVALSDALDASKVSIPANVLLSTGGTAADATSAYAFTLSATDDPTTLGASGLRGSARVSGMMARGSSAYLSEAYHAMQAARTQATVNPLSSFYSVLLPQGLSHSLNQTATLTLQYDTAADPNLINVYYFNGSQYIIEPGLRVVDPVNHTISVGVSHFSTFVILENSQPVIQVNGATANTADIEVFNFPNPFDLHSKTKTLTHGGTSTSITTEGTVIRYIVPAAKAGPASVEIYNIVGEKVRTIQLGALATDTYNYVEWDGRNQSGKQVASGVYIGLLKVGSEKKFFKMAVIK